MSDSVRPHRQQPSRLPHPWDSPGKNIRVGCHFLFQCIKGKVKVKSISRVQLSDLMDCSLPGSSIRGIFQARTLEWVAISFSSAWKVKWKWSHLVVSNLATSWTAAYQAPPSMEFSRREYWSGLPLPSSLSTLNTFKNMKKTKTM